MPEHPAQRRGHKARPRIDAPRRASYWEVRLDLPFRPEDIFRAWTDDELTSQWMTGGFLKEIKLEPRLGGRWCYRYSDGVDEWEQHGTFTRFVRNSLVEATEESNDEPTLVSILSLTRASAGTHVTYRTVYVDERVRDRSMAAGYADNIVTLFEAMSEYLERVHAER